MIGVSHTALDYGDWSIEALADPRLAAVTVMDSRLEVGDHRPPGPLDGGNGDNPPFGKSSRTPLRNVMVLLLDRSADTFIARRARDDASVVKPFTAAELRSAMTQRSQPQFPLPPAAPKKNRALLQDVEARSRSHPNLSMGTRTQIGDPGDYEWEQFARMLLGGKHGRTLKA